MELSRRISEGKVKEDRRGEVEREENCVSSSLRSEQVVLVLRRSDALNLSKARGHIVSAGLSFET